jgi:hypothetical protein
MHECMHGEHFLQIWGSNSILTCAIMALTSATCWATPNHFGLPPTHFWAPDKRRENIRNLSLGDKDAFGSKKFWVWTKAWGAPPHQSGMSLHPWFERVNRQKNATLCFNRKVKLSHYCFSLITSKFILTDRISCVTPYYRSLGARIWGLGAF